MKGEREVVAAALAAARAGERGILATVVRVEGSAYRRPGARMFLPEGREPVGLVSGGCLEADLRERAAAALVAGRPHTVLYDMRSPDDVVWGLGLGCDGAVRVLLEAVGPGEPPAWLDFLDRCFAERRAGVVATIFEVAGVPGVEVGARLLVGADGSLAQGLGEPGLERRVLAASREVLRAERSRVFREGRVGTHVEALLEYAAPPLRLLVFGAGPDALPVTECAASLGYRVAVFDHRQAYARPERFPAADEVRLVDFERLAPGGVGAGDARTAAVLMTHHFLHDAQILAALLDLGLPYVGLLGPRRRAENLLAELRRRGIEVPPDRLRGLYGPVGLDLGAETPEEIAVSVLAEIQAVFAERGGGHLREREAPLHDPAS